MHAVVGDELRSARSARVNLSRAVIFDNNGYDPMDFWRHVISLNNAVNTKTFLSVVPASLMYT